MSGTWGDLATWGDWGLWGDPFAVEVEPPPTSDPASPGPKPPTFPFPRVSWTVGGLPTSMFDWSYSTSWDGGFDQMRGSLTLADLNRTDPRQGTKLKAFSDGGVVLWEGRIATPPKVTDAAAYISGQGYRVEAQKETSRLFIQSRDMSIWQPTDGEPFVDSSGVPVYNANKNISVDIRNRIKFRVDRNVTVPADRRNGAVFYAEGVNIKKVAFVQSFDDSDMTTSLTLRAYRSDGPNGSPTGDQTFVSSWSLNVDSSSGNPQSQTFATAQDLIILYLHSAVSFSPSDPAEYILTKVRVWSDVTSAETYDGSEVMAYIADALGWDTGGISSQTFDVLPFDWQDGSWADAATYVAEIEDRYWRVLDDRGDGPYLEYNDWGATTWTCYLSRGCQADLTPEELFNEVWVWYETPSGVRRKKTVTFADINEEDPLLAAGITNVYEYELNDRQADGTLATNVGKKLLRRFIRPRLSGSLDVQTAFDDAGNSRPFEIRAGDVIRIADYAANEAKEFRVMDTDVSASSIRCGVEREVNLEALLNRPKKRRSGRANR